MPASVDLLLPMAQGLQLTSRSQLARVRSEAWAARELYCLDCSENRLTPLRANTAVSDFACASCSSRYQLKAKAGPFGSKVANSGYEKKIAAILEDRAPNYVFLSYRPDAGSVDDAFAIPGRYFSPAIIERRAALGPLARRHGWVGSNILLGGIGTLGRVRLVEDGAAVDPALVRSHWNRLRFLHRVPPRMRGWLNETWLEIQRIGEVEFPLARLYEAERTLGARHPSNLHVRAKLRQQVQLLRDHGFLDFLGRGRYRIRGGPWNPSPRRSTDL